jgi:glycine betaine catabolism B
MKIKSFFQDVLSSAQVTKRRREAIKRASLVPDGKDPIGEVARALHPGKIKVRLSSIRSVSPSGKTLTFEAVDVALPYFKAGQYMTLEVPYLGSIITRTYSISSAPYETRGEHPFVEITIKRLKKDGLVSDYLLDEAKVGDEFIAEIGLGQFFHEPLRDSTDLVFLAGGSGVTPFHSMIKEMKKSHPDYRITLIYGSRNKDDILLRKELDSLDGDNVRIVYVLSEADSSWDGETGFLSANLIRKYSYEDSTYFICGPQPMYDYVLSQLKELSVPERRIRHEENGQNCEISAFPGYPLQAKDKVFHILVKRGVKEDLIEARADESIAVSLERAGIKIHIGCRSGACGFCRLKVEQGTYFVSPHTDYRRAADKEFSYVHACSTYPTSDLVIRTNID